MKYKNKYSDLILTEEQYLNLLKREAVELWDSLDDDEKDEWTLEQYIDAVMFELDTDFIEIED